LTVPEVVGRLAAIGAERYHVDYSRQQITYYLANEDSQVVAALHEPHATATQFESPVVEAAVRQSQRGEHTYADFVRKTMAAGCVGYFGQNSGKRAIYFGRKTESHVEHLLSAPVAQKK
jgi:uncharacterized protein YbcV (DUF1398 family)